MNCSCVARHRPKPELLEDPRRSEILCIAHPGYTFEPQRLFGKSEHRARGFRYEAVAPPVLTDRVTDITGAAVDSKIDRANHKTGFTQRNDPRLHSARCAGGRDRFEIGRCLARMCQRLERKKACRLRIGSIGIEDCLRVVDVRRTQT